MSYSVLMSYRRLLNGYCVVSFGLIDEDFWFIMKKNANNSVRVVAPKRLMMTSPVTARDRVGLAHNEILRGGDK